MNAPVISTIRRATQEDIPHMLEICREAYPGRNPENGIAWARWTIEQPDFLVLTGRNVMGIAHLNYNYGYELRGRADMIAARKGAGLETFRMVREMVRWARASGAEGTFWVDADTDVDFGPFARRLGGYRSPQKAYEIPL